MKVSEGCLIKDCPSCGAEISHKLDCEYGNNLYYIPKVKKGTLLEINQRGFPPSFIVEEKKKRGRPKKLPKVLCLVRVSDIIKALAMGKYLKPKNRTEEK